MYFKYEIYENILLILSGGRGERENITGYVKKKVLHMYDKNTIYKVKNLVIKKL